MGRVNKPVVIILGAFLLRYRKIYPQISQIAQIKNFLKITSVKSVKICVICGLVFLLLLGFFLLTNEEEEKERVVDAPPPQIEVAAFRLVETREGKKEWVIEAEKASQFEEKTELSKFKTEFYLGSETKSLTLSGDSGVISRGNIEAFKDVRAKALSGMEVSTPYLRWDSDSKKITTPDSAVIVDEGLIIKGKNLSLDPEKEKVEMEKVRIEIE